MSRELCRCAGKGLISSRPWGWGCKPCQGWADFVTGAKHVAVQILCALLRVVVLVLPLRVLSMYKLAVFFDTTC
jgi:hypothetical protein